ncbi:DNA mismatch repair protein MutL [Longimonas halophila]|uniref:DNA mismatch repair protein MutL n=1 Tax=Longimonas halophila TaxID=1469170 RepID=A0A2H3NJD1_9BACT|nr:DNA mismatch repair endonuclease MutL [Longimonas halophila]PEN05538.1 DNA mismatch repair protein MutL [Longimonas halophila]
MADSSAPDARDAPPDAGNRDTSNDGLIRQLPDVLANKIAAGEVVQRPASVVKELIENALDAGASRITVRIKDAGRTLIQVTDDGCGMSRADAKRSFQRHATSKIRGIDDLERIRTLGFRGEALASIGAVAQVELKTRRVEDDIGTLVQMNGGTMETHRPCATPAGTTISVRNLFYNVPARRNFLKTPATEMKHISDTIYQQALAHPGVHIELDHDDRSIVQCEAATAQDDHERLRFRIRQLWTEDRAATLLPVSDASSYLRVWGLVAHPERVKSTREDQFLFVNDRAIQDRYLSHAVRKAYGDWLPDKAFPFFTLFLELDPERVDVNVHPTKAEVKFEDESGIYGLLRSSVREALKTQFTTPQFDPCEADASATSGGASGAPSSSRPTPVSFGDAEPSASPTTSSRSSSGSRSAPSSGSAPTGSRANAGATASQSGPLGPLTDRLYRPEDEVDADASDEDTSAPKSTPGHGPVWVLHGRYLLVPIDEGLMVVDPRAAHRRILYERYQARLQQESGESQQLLFAETIDLSVQEAERFEGLQDELAHVGFDAESLSGRTVALRGIPPKLDTERAVDAFRALLSDDDSTPESATETRHKAWARTLASRQALDRVGDWALEERRAFIRTLWQCEVPYVDPSGTPTLIRLSLDEVGALLNKA